MRDYAQIIGKITSTPWAIEPNALKFMLELMDAHITGAITQDEIRVRLADAERRGTKSHATRVQNIGVLGITGPIFPKANLMTELSGGTSIQQFRQEFRSMMADDAIDAILLDVDSPGGLSEGIEEMADEIYRARPFKPIYSIANAAANSAAYWLASQAGEVFSTQSGQIGSVGTYMVHTDESAAMEKEGVKETVIKAGRFKAVSMEPLTSATHGVLQDFVDQTNERFLHGVARGRNTDVDHVRSNYGEGMVVTPQRGLDAGMIDGIATFESVLSHIGGQLQEHTPVQVSWNGAHVPIVTSGSHTPRTSYDADMEHSEPGTGQGGEPTPRTPPEEGDPAIEGGWRRDPPPPAYETEEFAVNRTWLEEQATLLSIEYDKEVTDEDLAATIAARVSEVVTPMQGVAQAAQEDREFRERYPEQAQQLEDMLSEQRVTRAAQFADSYRVFEDDSNYGFAPVVRDALAQAHQQVASRNFSHDDLKSLVDAMASKTAKIPLSEGGSSRVQDRVVVTPGHFAESRKVFSGLVRDAMKEDNLTMEAAIEHVSAQNPELAQAYLTGHVG